MLQTRGIYVFLFSLVTMFFLFSSSYLAYLLLITMLVGTVLSLLYVFLWKRKVDVKINTPTYIEKHTSGTIAVDWHNRQFLPIPFIQYTISVKNLLTGSVTEDVLQTSLSFYGRKRLEFELENTHCGMLEIQIVQAFGTDFFRLWKKELHIEKKASMIVVPSIYDGEFNYRTLAKENAEMALFSSEVKGEMEEETIGLKEYVPGDNVKHIHWKLSSKLDSLFIKELADVREERMILLVETSIHIEREEKRVKAIDQIMDTCISIAHLLLQDQKHLHISWYDNELDQLYLEEIVDQRMLQSVMHKLLGVSIGTHASTSYEQFLQSEQKDAVVCYITSDQHDEVISIDETGSILPIYAEQWLEQAQTNKLA